MRMRLYLACMRMPLYLACMRMRLYLACMRMRLYLACMRMRLYLACTTQRTPGVHTDSILPAPTQRLHLRTKSAGVPVGVRVPT